MKQFNNLILAIARFPLRIPAIWYLILLYVLFQVLLPFNMVECSGGDSYNVNPTISDIPQVEESPKPILETKDSSALISEGLKTIGNSIYKIAPALAGISAGIGTSKILKTLPPQHRAGSIITAGAFSGGITLVSQAIARIPYPVENPQGAPAKGFCPYLSDNNLDSNPKEDNISSPPDFNVNSPFELEFGSPEEGLILAIIIFTIGALYAVYTVLFNLLARSFNLESRPFVTSRPKLAKWISYALKGHTWWSIITLFLAWLCM